MKSVVLFIMVLLIASCALAVVDEGKLDALDMDMEGVMSGLQEQSEKMDKVQKDLSDHRNQMQEEVYLVTDSTVPAVGEEDKMTGAFIKYHQGLVKKTDTIVVDNKKKEHPLKLDGAEARAKAEGRLKSMELTVKDGTLYYKIDTLRDAKILGLIDMDLKVTTYVDAATGAAEEKLPWYKMFFITQ